MKEKTLLKMALICSIVGIFALFLFAEKLEPKLIQISEISYLSIDKNIKIQGEIIKFKKTKSTNILQIKDQSGSINVILFENLNNLEKGKTIEIIGKVSEYKDELQIEAKKVKLF